MVFQLAQCRVHGRRIAALADQCASLRIVTAPPALWRLVGVQKEAPILSDRRSYRGPPQGYGPARLELGYWGLDVQPRRQTS